MPPKMILYAHIKNRLSLDISSEVNAVICFKRFLINVLGEFNILTYCYVSLKSTVLISATLARAICLLKISLLRLDSATPRPQVLFFTYSSSSIIRLHLTNSHFLTSINHKGYCAYKILENYRNFNT